MHNNDILIGCIADDFTGASDAASFIAHEGIKTILCNGLPKNINHLNDCQAIVIALKTRNVSCEESLKLVSSAFMWLSRFVPKHLYFKYCSTFDSTKEGNIGSVVDYLLEHMGLTYTLISPSLPINRRTVKNGHLYVDGVPLEQSHMKNHPLNPMWDSDISKLMAPQSKYSSMILSSEDLAKSESEIFQLINKFGKDRKHFYIIPDFITDDDGRRISEVFGTLQLLSGSSGLLQHIASKVRCEVALSSSSLPSRTAGKGIALSGSCSKMTSEQIKYFKANGGRHLMVEPNKLLKGEQNIEHIWNFIKSADSDVLIYSHGGEENLINYAPHVNQEESSLLEKTMAQLGNLAYQNGFTRIIVGGGETSGAVAQELAFDCFFIGESVAPGVPIMIPVMREDLRIVLKSGNFGEENFFVRAFEMTRLK